MVCPQCYHRSPFPDIAQRIICSQCKNGQCNFSESNTDVCACRQCGKGKMILNQAIQGKYNLTCNMNNCMNIITVAENATKVSRIGKKCQNCASSVLNIKFVDGDEVTCCVFCDMDYNRYVYRPEIKVSQKSIKDEPRGGAGDRNQGKFADKRQTVDNKKAFNAKVTERKVQSTNGDRRDFGSSRGGERGGERGGRGRGSDRGSRGRGGDRGGRGGAMRENNNQRPGDSYNTGGKHVQSQAPKRGGSFGSNQNMRGGKPAISPAGGGRGGPSMRGGNNRRPDIEQHSQGGGYQMQAGSENRGPFNN